MLTIAFEDISGGLQRLQMSFILALEDLKDRYRRSLIGLAWIVISFLGFIAIKQLVFDQLMATDSYDFFSHLVIGFAIFTFISAVVPGATNLFVASRTWILSTDLPYSVYANTMVLRALSELALVSVAATILIAIWGNVQPGSLWTLIPAIGLYYLAAFSLSLLLAPIGTRYRDVVYAVQTGMRMLFFATPIIWIPTDGTIREIVAKWNPLSYFIDLVRVPIMSGSIPVYSWLVSGLVTLVLLFAGLVVFSTTKRRIPIWL